MEHARKMILVPADSVKNTVLASQINDLEVGLERKKSESTDCKTVQTPGNVLTRLDREMYEILNGTTANAHDKWLLYSQVLQRFLNFAKDENKPSNIVEAPIKSQEETIAEDREEEEGITALDNHIIEAVPDSFRKCAILLLKRLHRAGEKQITWDSNDRVSIDGEIIEGANMVDLINDALRARKYHEAVGRAQFAELIRRIGVPKEIIKNSFFWAEKDQRSRLVAGLKRKTPARRDDAMDVDNTLMTPVPDRKKARRNTIGTSSSESDDEDNTAEYRDTDEVAQQTVNTAQPSIVVLKPPAWSNLNLQK